MENHKFLKTEINNINFLNNSEYQLRIIILIRQNILITIY